MAKRAPMSEPSIQVDLVSDFVCPWCWLGYKQFLKAAQGVKPMPALTFRPYMLDPSVPDDGQDYKAYMAAKFGADAKDRFADSRAHLERSGKSFGIDFDFSAITRRPNSLNAHRLLKWAQEQDAGPAVAQSLFRAYHEQGRDIGDTDVLATIAEAAGLDSDTLRDRLDGDEDKLDIQQEIMFFRGLGISGVPTFIYNGQFAVQGAQDPDTHKRAFKQSREAPPQT